jgi:peptide/nickel transport system permease protein
MMNKALRHLATIIATVILGGFLTATMVRLAPGFSVDEQQLDPRLSAGSIQALRAARAGERNIGHFYLEYLVRAGHGDLGVSRSLNRPVRALLAERLPATIRCAGLGLLLAWAIALVLAVSAAMLRASAYDAATTVVAGLFLCVPAAVLALLSLFANGPAPAVVALIVFPRLYRYCRNLLAKTYRMPHLITAYAKGAGEARVFCAHVLPVAAPQLLAVAGVSVSMAFGAAVPVEAVCGIPGIGQLAWQAALARDLPLLVTITVLVTIVTLLANLTSDVVAAALVARAE